jgi:hypothetical protein
LPRKASGTNENPYAFKNNNAGRRILILYREVNNKNRELKEFA